MYIKTIDNTRIHTMLFFKKSKSYEYLQLEALRNKQGLTKPMESDDLGKEFGILIKELEEHAYNIVTDVAPFNRPEPYLFQVIEVLKTMGIDTREYKQMERTLKLSRLNSPTTTNILNGIIRAHKKLIENKPS